MNTEWSVSLLDATEGNSHFSLESPHGQIYLLNASEPDELRNKIKLHTMGNIKYKGRDFLSPHELDFSDAFKILYSMINKTFRLVSEETNIFSLEGSKLYCNKCNFSSNDYRACIYHIPKHKKEG